MFIFFNFYNKNSVKHNFLKFIKSSAKNCEYNS